MIGLGNVFIFFNILLIVIFSFLFKYKIMISNKMIQKILMIQLISLKIKFFFLKIFAHLSFLSSFIFSCQNWLPRFSNPGKYATF